MAFAQQTPSAAALRRPRFPALFGHCAALTVVTCVLGTRIVAAFNLDDVAAKAQKVAAEAYQDPSGQVPAWLTKITYDQWRDIRFRPEHALWHERRLPFHVQFFHPGLYYNRVVAVNVVDARGSRPVEFSPSQFNYGHNDFASKVPQNLGYAGFRMHAPIKTGGYYDEVIVFLGASYFRAVGQHDVFGLSARGLAIDTALPSGEEFPYFKEFWLVTPVEWATDVVVYALLDSPSLTGAYRFIVQPGERTTVHVEGRLFLRREVQTLGLAPLTSMFFHGENANRPFEDFRPEAHDSDGLLLSFNTGEWLWRPLDNARTLQVNTVHMPNPKGFGLIQRDRDFDHYQDLETHAERRPSVWITPRTGWGDGRIELVEIPTKSDTNDNIVAFWVPEKQPKPGEPVVFAYTMYWYSDDATGSVGGRVTATRRDRGTTDGAHRFVVDFAGPKLEALPPETVLRGVVSVASDPEAADLLDQQVVKNPATGGWRLTFQVQAKRRDPIELRAFLDKGGETLTETWSYVLLP